MSVFRCFGAAALQLSEALDLWKGGHLGRKRLAECPVFGRLPIPTGPIMDITQRMHGCYQGLDKQVQDGCSKVPNSAPFGLVQYLAACYSLNRGNAWTAHAGDVARAPICGMDLMQFSNSCGRNSETGGSYSGPGLPMSGPDGVVVACE